MKKILVILGVVGVVLTFAAGAMACTPVTCPGAKDTTWYSMYDPTDVKITAPGYKEFMFDFTDDAPPFQVGVDDIYKATLKVWVRDDGGRRDGAESFTITIDGANLYTGHTWNFHDYSGLINGTGLTSLNADGKLLTRLTATQGDFWFEKMSLTANGCDYTSVPEPTTMLLLGLGLVGLAGVRRKIKK